MQHRANLRPSKNTLATRAGLVAVAAGKSVPMTQTELTNLLLTKVPLFEGFDPAVVAEITAGSELCTFEGNEAIVECGDPGLFLGVLVSGHAEVSIPDNTGGRVTVGQLHDGDVFGEAPMLTGDPHAANVVAGNRCFVLQIGAGVFASHLLTQPKAIARLSKLLAERARAQSTDPAAAGTAPGPEDPYLLSIKTDDPGKILAVNFGITQVRFGVHDTQDERLNVRGVVEHRADGGARIRLVAGGVATAQDIAAVTPGRFFDAMFEWLQALEPRYQFAPHDVIAVGHRVAHGGNKFSSAAVITPSVIADVEALAVFAPQHSPVNLEGIRAAMKSFPAIPHVAVFDTAFHQTLPTYAYLYGLPYDYYKKEGIRRYGFHGTSHRYVSLKAAEIARRPLGELEIISCHLGVGASLCAIDHGRSVDTTMGMTPSDGLIMATRSGSLDPAVMIHLMEHYKLGPDELSRLVNSESGLKGLSGISSDIAEIEQAADEGHHRALLAHKAFCYQIRKNIGAYVAAMGGVDVLAFTGSVGETSPTVRSLACQGLNWMGIKLDEAKNRSLGPLESHAVISTDDSPVKILVIANNDERLLAWETLRAIERDQISVAIKGSEKDAPIPIEVSAHHVHLAQTDVERLFGPGHKLTPEAELSQPGQFACAEKVDLIGPKGRITGVRVLGPTRKETQVEIAMTEQFKVGVNPPIRESGDLVGTPGITLQGPYGMATIDRGVICAQRHIHMTPEDARRFRLRDRYVVRVRIEGDRGLVFGDVVVRVNPGYRLAMHIDTDEGNAASIQTGMIGYIEAIQSRY
jgi:acetate kinase